MDHSMINLSLAAIGVAAAHTLMGPDHYMPFVALAKSRSWSLRKALAIGLVCGVGHVLSSVVLGLIGIAAGISLEKLVGFESGRGRLAGWLLLAFGLVYMSWGVVQAFRNRMHTHEHVHVSAKRALGAWTLFIVFVMGPCEPLIPLLMFPAATIGMAGVFWVAALFGLVTLGVMALMITLSLQGLRLVPEHGLERFGHAVAGSAIFFCGLAIQLGL